MNKKILLLLLTISPVLVQAQGNGWLKKINDKIKNKATDRANRKIDKTIDNVLDSVEQTKLPAPKSDNRKITPADTSIAGTKLYVRYDFIPGEQVIYSNDFATDVPGELPTGWNSNGTGAVVAIDQVKKNGIQLYQNTAYLTDNTASFSENFTLEFDLLLRRTNDKAPFPELTWGVLSSGALPPGHNDLLKGYAGTFATEMNIQPADNNRSTIQLQTYANHKVYFKTDIQKPVSHLQQYNQVIHVAMQVQKERLRIWLNDQKMYDLPKAILTGTDINQLYFLVKRYGGPEQEVGYAVTNIKIAKGLPDTRHKLVTEGKFSTTGILFAVNSHTILPESNGVLNEIAGILSKNPDLKIKVIGHTDSDGAEEANLDLSRRRAASVKQCLVNDFKITGDRILSEGAGESKPASDNTTKEGKANNRRVEFVKI